ncbi:hypothetical protein [Natroniella sp. ANB-PHB2]
MNRLIIWLLIVVIVVSIAFLIDKIDNKSRRKKCKESDLDLLKIMKGKDE